MTTAEIPSPPFVDRRVSDNQATILTFPSQLEEGFFDLEQDAVQAQDERNFVIDRKFLSHDKSRHGDITTEVFTFRNGKELEVVSGRPAHQRSDVPIVTTTALGTSIRGHNRHNLIQGMKLGYAYVLIGPEGGHAHLPKTPREILRFIKNLGNISLEEIAENMHEVLDVTDEDDFYEPGMIAATGESRSADAALGVVARAKKFGRTAIYADTTALVFPVPRHEIDKHAILPLETVEQVSFLGQLPLKMHPKRLLHYPETLNLNPHFLLHVIATIPTLLDGSAGKLGREVPYDAHIHNTLFTEDTWSYPAGWDAIFANHAGVVNTLRPGNHMAITSKRTQAERTGRLAGLRDELAATHNRPKAINWDNVHMGGRLAVREA
jgi:hypothetical protein